MYDPKRIKRRAIFVSLALLPVAFLIAVCVAGPTTTGAAWVIGTLIAELFLCLLLGGFCLFVGIAISFGEPQSEAGQELRGFGAALAAIVFTAWHLSSLFSSDRSDSE